ncbi:hypothetical protein DFAR_3960002 [Desulfarculales bacterium]
MAPWLARLDRLPPAGLPAFWWGDGVGGNRQPQIQEVGMQLVERWILAVLRKRTFLSLAEPN